MDTIPGIEFLDCTNSRNVNAGNIPGFTVGRLGNMGYDPGPTFRQQVANADEISLDKIKNEYRLIVEKKSRLSARQRALILYKVQEYKKLGIV